MDNRTESARKGQLPDTNSPLPVGRPTWAEIDLQALTENYRTLCSLVPPAATNIATDSSALYPRIIPVIKADAYGHGAIQIASAVAGGADVRLFSVGIVEEGVALRQAGINQEILVLGTTWRGLESLALHHRLTLALDSVKSMECLDAAAKNMDVSSCIHIKVDTGMGRLGIRWDAIEPLLDGLRQLKHLSLKGVFSHLSSADEQDPEYTLEQKRRFEHALSAIRKAGFTPGEIHFANSAGLLYHESFRQWSARTGIALYGYAPDPQKSPIKLRPVLSLKTKIGPIRQVREGESIGYSRKFTAPRTTRYTTLPVGYADGLRRSLAGHSRVIIRNGWAEVIGAISMDMITVDLTDRPDVREGEEVILLGSTTECRITASEWADTLGTIPYEILCGIASRVPRIYV
jgi:alanine racemase